VDGVLQGELCIRGRVRRRERSIVREMWRRHPSKDAPTPFLVRLEGGSVFMFTYEIWIIMQQMRHGHGVQDLSGRGEMFRRGLQRSFTSGPSSNFELFGHFPEVITPV
jgi:hypothetical protein